MAELLSHRLLVVLRAEETLYTRLRDVLQQQREVVAQMDLEALEGLTRRQEELSDEARLLEESRLELAGELAASLGLAEQGTRLSEICARLGASAGELRDAHNRLVILVGVVRELLDANAMLIGSSLVDVRTTLRALGSHLPEDVTYRPGARVPAPEAGRLVRRSA